MAFSDSSMYPKGVTYHASVGATPVVIAAVTTNGQALTERTRKVNHFVVSNVAAATAHTVTFRAIADTPVYLIVRLAASTTIVIPGWSLDGATGLEALADANNDIHISTFWLQ